MTPEEHHACLSRIRNAKSRVDISHLRKAMKGSRSEESTDTPIFVPGSLSPMRSDSLDQMPPPRHADPTDNSVLIPMDEHDAGTDDTTQQRPIDDEAVPSEAVTHGRSGTPLATESKCHGEGSSGASRTLGDPSTDATAREADAAPSHAGESTRGEQNAAAKVTALLEECSKELSLEDMDDVLEAVRAFKLARFGPC